MDFIAKAINREKEQIVIASALKVQTNEFTQLLFNTLFYSDTDTEESLFRLEELFTNSRDLVCPHRKGSPCKRWNDFYQSIPELLHNLKLDGKAILDHDPAAHSINEVYLAYPGFFAIAVYRMAREFYKLNLPIIPRLMTEYAHQKTGIDINPGAEIGKSFFIDHGTGVVIGETCVIKDHVKIYQGVTLGALSVKKEERNKKRHPTIEDHVTIYANATILGGNTIIGANSIIGGNTWLTKSIPPNSIVSHQSTVEVIPKLK